MVIDQYGRETAAQRPAAERRLDSRRNCVPSTPETVPDDRPRRTRRHLCRIFVAGLYRLETPRKKEWKGRRNMTPLAWIFMLSAWTIIIGCTVYCFAKLMGSKNLESDDSNAEG